MHAGRIEADMWGGGGALAFPQHGRDGHAQHVEVGDAVAACVFHTDDGGGDAARGETDKFWAHAELKLL